MEIHLSVVVAGDIGVALGVDRQRVAGQSAADRLATLTWAADMASGHDTATTTLDEPERFGFDFAPAYRRVARMFGVTPSTAWVEVQAATLSVRFGLWRLRTPLANITAVQPTGPYAFFKTAGPARLAVTDRGLTFASNGRRGLLIMFRTPVPGLEPTGLLRHPELTVTVADVDALASLLRARIAT